MRTARNASVKISRNKRKRQPMECSVEAVATMIGCLQTQALAFLAVFVYATHTTQAIAFEWKPGFSHRTSTDTSRSENSLKYNRLLIQSVSIHIIT